MKFSFWAVVVLATTTALTAGPARSFNFERSHDLALRQMEFKKPEEALATFLSMAEQARNPYQLTEALRQAAQLEMTAERPEKAFALIEKIPLLPYRESLRIDFLVRQKEWDKIIVLHAETDFTTWPDSAAEIAFYGRGKAYLETKNPDLAEKDWIETARRTTRTFYFFELGNLAMSRNNDLLAMNAYDKTQRTLPDRMGWIYMTATINRGRILQRNGHYEAGLVELQKMDGTSGYWQAVQLSLRAQFLTLLGRTDEAIAVYQQAVLVENAPGGTMDGIKADYEKLLQSLNK